MLNRGFQVSIQFDGFGYLNKRTRLQKMFLRTEAIEVDPTDTE